MEIDRSTGTDVPLNKGIESLGELEICQVVRSEFISPTFRPKMTFNFDSISFSGNDMTTGGSVIILIDVRTDDTTISRIRKGTATRKPI